MMQQTMEQLVRSGLAFNPLAASDGQGEAFVGNAQTRLSDAMKSHDWQDMRFLSKNQIDQAGWTLSANAEPVQITFKAGEKWDNKVLYNASHIVGIPSLASMVDVANARLAQTLASQHGMDASPQFPEINPEMAEAASVSDIAEAQRRLAEKRRAEEDELARQDLEEEEADLVVGPARIRDEHDETMGITPVFRDNVISAENPILVAEQMANQQASVLLGTRFKERVPGSGEYTREGQTKIAFLDKGKSLVVRDKQSDSYQAVMELAKSKGWQEIELSGKPEHLARGWLEAQLLGIKVANYVPNEKDMAALDQRRSAMAGPAQSEVLPVPEGAKLVSSGQYIGKVVDVKDGYVIQNAGAGNFVAHKLSEFAPKPMVGDPLDVHYKEGKVASWHPREASKDLGGGREIGGR